MLHTKCARFIFASHSQALQVSHVSWRKLKSCSVLNFLRFLLSIIIITIITCVFSVSVDWFSTKFFFISALLCQIGNISSSNMYNYNRWKRGQMCKREKKNEWKIEEIGWWLKYTHSSKNITSIQKITKKCANCVPKNEESNHQKLHENANW